LRFLQIERSTPPPLSSPDPLSSLIVQVDAFNQAVSYFLPVACLFELQSLLPSGVYNGHERDRASSLCPTSDSATARRAVSPPACPTEFHSKGAKSRQLFSRSLATAASPISVSLSLSPQRLQKQRQRRETLHTFPLQLMIVAEPPCSFFFPVSDIISLFVLDS